MGKFTPYLKHHILSQYSSNSTRDTFASLAAQYHIHGGASTICRWMKKWNGTPQSLERKNGSGRKCKLDNRQMNNYIRTPINNKRRGHHAVHYPDLMPTICRKLSTPISLRTIQRYGKDRLGVKLIRTKKKTLHECEYIHS